MKEILEFYQEQMHQGRSSQPWLALLQSKASERFNKQGFPTRHHEEWKYTSLDAFLKHSFVSPELMNPEVLSSYTSDIPLKPTVLIHNGTLQHSLTEGPIILPLSQALVEYHSLIQAHLGSILHQEHAFHFLNTAMLQKGLFIYIPEGMQVDDPIVISHIQDQENQGLYLRHLIIAEAHSKATVIEDYNGQEGCCYLTNTITEIALSAKAQLTHYKIQRESKSAYHLGHIAVKQGAHSQFATHSLSLGGRLVRSDLSIHLQEEHASCLLNGIYAPAQGQHVDHHTTVHHLVPNCLSDQDYKGILTGHSRAVFNGKVIVYQDAQHTNAKQQNKNLLLSAQAEVDTKPQLEIFADDVCCTHGATVGQLDEDALFYLATRGIDRGEASQFLIHAFAQDNLQRIPHSSVADWVRTLLTGQLE